jgi:hypothetical protein
MSIINPNLKTAEDCIALASKLNPQKEPLTAAKLRTFPGCEHYTEQEAEAIVQTIDQLTVILFECAQTKDTCIENQQVVYLKTSKEPDVVPLGHHQTKTIAA